MDRGGFGVREGGEELRYDRGGFEEFEIPVCVGGGGGGVLGEVLWEMGGRTNRSLNSSLARWYLWTQSGQVSINLVTIAF